MGREYTLDTDAAKQANTGGKRITESGAYAGKLKAAFYEKNAKGTESVNLMFESDNGQEIGPLAIYTHNGDGVELPGYNAFNALLTCLRVRGIKTTSGRVELYDYDSKVVVTKDKEVYSDLSGKAVGLFLRREEYQKQNGDIGERMTVAGSFEPSTKLMANEILAKKTEAVNYEQMAAWLDKDPVKKLKGRNGSASASTATQRTAADDFADDDIPF